MTNELAQVDCTGHRWFPQVGDQIRDVQMMRYGVVLDVRQHAEAPAVVTVSLEGDDEDPAATPWQVFERGVEHLERDTRNDVEVPALREITMELGEASARVLADVQLLGQLRSRVATSDELVGVLEIEAQRCLHVGEAAIAVHRYDVAARERERACQLRWLAAAVRTVIELTGYRP